MTRFILFLSVILWTAAEIPAQSSAEEPSSAGREGSSEGKVSARIFTHFNWSLNRRDPFTAFEVKRAYFGYSREIHEHFTGEVKLDIGSPDDVSEYSLIRRYTYFKNAYISYQKGKLKSWFGLFDMLQFKVQEKFWGYRYIYRSYMDEYRFGPSADLGIGAQYRVSDAVTADLIISNGEGYKNLQFDNIDKVGMGITLFPLPDLTCRAYYSVHTSSHPQMTLAGFVGYRTEKFRIGGEYILQKNYNFNKNHNRYGYSLYATCRLAERWELFARYDQVFSNVLPESDIPWNLADDGSAIVSGIQFAPVEMLHISINYQDWVEYAQNGESHPYIYLNFGFDF